MIELTSKRVPQAEYEKAKDSAKATPELVCLVSPTVILPTESMPGYLTVEKEPIRGNALCSRSAGVPSLQSSRQRQGADRACIVLFQFLDVDREARSLCGS